MPSLTHEVKHNSQLSRRILSAVRDRIIESKRAYDRRHTAWRKQEEMALAYLHEDQVDRLRAIERDQYGKPELTTIRIPYSYGVLMSSHTYWSTVFLSRNPIHQYAGRHGETEQQVQALEAVIDYQVQVGEMLVPLYIWLLDAGKYGLGAIAVNWHDEYAMISAIEETPVMFMGMLDTGKTKKQKVNRRVPGYSGNKLMNIRPFDFYPDPRVPVREFQKGEYCARYVEISWNNILKRLEQGYYIEEVVDELRNRQPTGTSGYGTSGFETERVYGSDRIQLPENASFDLESYDSGSETKRNLRNAMVPCYEMCIELVPKDWRLGVGGFPEKWMFTITTDYKHVLGAQPLGANHNRFPYSVLEYEPEGYAINARGVGEVLKPINDTMDWLFNSHLFNIRKVLNDQLVVDPSQIVLEDLENPMPGGVIRLAPAAYGRDVKAAVMQLPVHDVTGGHLGELQNLIAMGQRTVGVSDQLQGQIPDNSRTSATATRIGSGFGVNRLKTVSEFFSAMGFAPLSAMMVQNTQQYYDQEQKFRIVGNLAQEAGQEFMQVDPSMLTGFYDFVPVDGTQPVDRGAQVQLWTNLIGQMAGFPEIMANYDMGRIFEWIAQLAGIKNISKFRVQMMPDEELLAQADQGNVVPLGMGGGSATQSPVPMNTGGGGPSPASQQGPY